MMHLCTRPTSSFRAAIDGYILGAGYGRPHEFSGLCRRVNEVVHFTGTGSSWAAIRIHNDRRDRRLTES